jgi:hypothetical protein
MKVKFEEKEEIFTFLQNQTVKDLKKMLQNFCGLPVEKMKLFEYKPDNNFLKE